MSQVPNEFYSRIPRTHDNVTLVESALMRRYVNVEVRYISGVIGSASMGLYEITANTLREFEEVRAEVVG